LQLGSRPVPVGPLNARLAISGNFREQCFTS
jgi:hypothetical protein